MKAKSWLLLLLLQGSVFLTAAIERSSVPSKKADNSVAIGVFQTAKPKSVVDNCASDESCVFSWACDRIRKPVRPCSGPFYFFTVCCKTGNTTQYLTEPEDVSTTMPEPVTQHSWLTSPAVTISTTVTSPQTTMTTVTLPRITPGPVRRVCGRAPLMSRVGRIVGGSAAQFGEFPFQVMVVIKGAEKCGGALLDHQWVVTAGHCVASASITASDLEVKLGVWDRTQTDEFLPTEERRLSKLILHPSYSSQRSFSQDVALLKLDKPVVYHPHIQPACLPSPGEDFTYLLGTITGWGRLQFREDRPNVLQKVQIPIITNRQCEEMFDAQHTPEKIIPDMICASSPNSTRDACQGDSGGPLSILRDGSYVLAGLVSWGYGCALPGYPGVYTRISQFTGWLEDTMRRES